MVLCYHSFYKNLTLVILLAGIVQEYAATAAAANPGGVSGIVFLDRSGQGVHDRDAPGFPGIVVTLFGKREDGSPLYLITRTDSQGRFTFPGALIGRDSTYTVSTGGAPLAAVLPTNYQAARTFFTATDGNDKNPGTREQPFRTIGHAVPLLEAGDLLYIRRGEYREYVSTANRPLGGGSGWDRPIVVAGMPGETVVIRPPDRDGSDPLINLRFQRQQYLVFDNLVLDAEDATLPFRSQSRDGKEPPPSHVRVINWELMHSKSSGVFFVGEDHQFINCRIHDNGHSNKDHGLHVSGGASFIHGCEIYLNSGSGIHLYTEFQESASNNVIRGNRIHDNGLAGGRPVPAGIDLNTGRNNLIYDNVLWANPFGIIVSNQGCEERSQQHDHRQPRLGDQDRRRQKDPRQRGPQQHLERKQGPELVRQVEDDDRRSQHGGAIRTFAIRRPTTFTSRRARMLSMRAFRSRKFAATTTAFRGPKARSTTAGPTSTATTPSCRPRASTPASSTPARRTRSTSVLRDQRVSRRRRSRKATPGAQRPPSFRESLLTRIIRSRRRSHRSAGMPRR